MKKRKIVISILASLLICTSFSFMLHVKAPSNTEAIEEPNNMTPVEYEKWVDTWQKPGHVYLHYNRGEKLGYDEYCLWIWQHKPKDLEGSLWAFSGDTKVSDKLTLKPMSTSWMSKKDLGLEGDGIHIDNYGVIVDIDINKQGLIGGKDGTPADLKGAKNVGFLLVKMSSMDGSSNWISDGGVETYIKDWNNPDHWQDGVETGSMHVYVSSGALSDYYFSVTGEVHPPKVNPTESDTSGVYRSKYETIKDTYKNSKTANDFTKLGVGYQIFVSSFRDSNQDGYGDIRGIIDALPYLKDLGVEVLWLTPIQTSSSYHGYDITDFFTIDSRFGSLGDYRELIFKAHKSGMKVLMDLVLNHTSKTNTWFKKSQWAVNSEAGEKDETGIFWRDVYSWKYATDKIWKYNHVKEDYEQITVENDAKSENPSWYRDGESNYYYYGKFGSGMPEINYENEATRELVKNMAKYWLSFGLDGFRLDAVKHIYMKDEVDIETTKNDIIIEDYGTKESYDDEKGKMVKKAFDYSSDLTKNVDWWKEFANDLKAIYPNCFLVGENFDGWGTRIAPYYQALDSQFSFSTYYHIAAKIYAFGKVDGFKGRDQETSVPFSSTNSFPLGDSGINVPGGGRSDYIDGAFTSNHDVYRAINQVNGSGSVQETVALNKVDGKNGQVDKAKIHGAITLLNSGLSWIYYGDELGMSSNTDKHVEMYGNENSMDIWYRQPLIWTDEQLRPNYKSGKYVFELDSYNKTLSGVALEGDKVVTNNTMYNWYKDIISIKKLYPTNAKVSVDESSGNTTLVLNVTGNGKALKIFINVGLGTDSYLMNPGNGYKVVKTLNFENAKIGDNIGSKKYSVVAFQAQ